MRVFVMVPCLTTPKILQLTLGTWLEQYDGSYKADVVIGLHRNYHHYHPGLPDIEKLGLSLSFVDEIDWPCVSKGSPWWEAVMRYSKMHALNVQEMMRLAPAEFTHAALLDHDLVFERDFIGHVLRERTDADFVGCWMDDRISIGKMGSDIGPVDFAPKFSVWHMTMSRRVFDAVKAEPELLMPGMHNEVMFDTMAWALAVAIERQWRVDVLTQAEMLLMVRHLWSLSFNFGYKEHKENQAGRMAEAEAEYDRRFPNGIVHLLEKLK